MVQVLQEEMKRQVSGFILDHRNQHLRAAMVLDISR